MDQDKNKSTIQDESVKTEETSPVEIQELDDLDLAKVAGGAQQDSNVGCINSGCTANN